MSQAAAMKAYKNLRRMSSSASAIAVVALFLGVVGCDDSSDPEDSDINLDAADGGSDAESEATDAEAESTDAGTGDAEADVAPDVELWPEPWEFHEDLGDIEDIPEEFRPLFVSFDVPALPEPGPNDWLTHYPEPGQTFDEFVASRPNLPNEDRYILYIQPLGESTEFELPTLEELQIFYEAYFSMEAQILEPIDPTEFNITERTHPSEGQRQLLTTDILNVLIRRMPDDAYSLIAVTMIDLYPADDWNYVFGQASLVNRAGVFSFARYDSPYPEYTLSRSFKVLAHEAGHMFGVLHCTHFHCLMNGSNHLGEVDVAPVHLCPIDLRKHYWAIGFDPAERYERLIEVYESFELYNEAEWIANRLSLSGF